MQNSEKHEKVLQENSNMKYCGRLILQEESHEISRYFSFEYFANLEEKLLFKRLEIFLTTLTTKHPLSGSFVTCYPMLMGGHYDVCSKTNVKIRKMQKLRNILVDEN